MVPDAPLGAADARPSDARMNDAMNVDAAVSCSVPATGATGTCLATAVCSGQGKMSVKSSEGATGCQSFPADVQCCVPKTTSQPGPDAGSIPSSGSCDPTARPMPNDGLTEEPGVDGCPAGMLRIAAAAPFCVDRFEASLEKVEADGSFSPWSPYFNPGTTKVIARSLRGAVPQGYITGEQAKTACAQAGKRLCTDTEFLRACKGPSSTTYPYGAARQNGVCNDARFMHPAVQLFGSVTLLASPCINQLQPGLDVTGGHSGCVTGEGAMDMMGNLHEWTADPNGTFRGGFYVDTKINGEGCLYATTAHNTQHYDYSTGFRCCAN
jgi:hypothetical protein